MNVLPGTHTDFPVVRVKHCAMATEFEALLANVEPAYASEAAGELFREIDRLEQLLSRFQPSSEISRINSLGRNERLTLGPETFECLERCQQLHRATSGAFDISVGPLMRCWLTPDKQLRQPDPDEVEAARARVGMDGFVLDGDAMQLTRVRAHNLDLDLGAFGKGYALDCVAELLSDWEIGDYFLHAGGSTVLVSGSPAPDRAGWPVSFRYTNMNGEEEERQVILSTGSLSGSGIEKGQHIMEPRLGRPVEAARAAWAAAPSAAVSDALSTAFMILDEGETAAYCTENPDVSALFAEDGRVVEFGELWGG